MTRAFHWLFPHPLLTLLLAFVWILLQNEFSAGMAVFGLILGIIFTKVTAIWWPERPGSIHIGRMVSYALIVMWDIIVANIEVAWIVLTKPNSKLKPAWIVVPLDLRQPSGGVRPSFDTIIATSFSTATISTLIKLHPECFTALVTASWTMRNTAN